jgi:hypothetical protein
MSYEHDVEKAPGFTGGDEKHAYGHGASIAEDGAVRGETFETGNGMRAKLMRLAGKFGVEQRGIERVPDDERNDNSLLNVGTMVRTFANVEAQWLTSFAVALRQHGRLILCYRSSRSIHLFPWSR